MSQFWCCITMDSFLQSSSKIYEMLSAIETHMNNGHAIHIDKWSYMRTNVFGIKIEDTLVSVRYEDTLFVYPQGHFQCGCCKSQNNVFEICGALRLDNSIRALICQQCALHKLTNTIHMQQHTVINYIKPEFVKNNDILVHILKRYPNIDFIDARLMSFKNMNGFQDLARNIAFAHDLTYLGGMHLKDVRNMFLAKRVLRRWKILVQKRREFALFNVLYHHLHDINASFMLARKYTIPS